MATNNPFGLGMRFDMSKLPDPLCLQTEVDLARALNGAWVAARRLSRNDDVATEVVHEALYCAVTDCNWDSAMETLREYFLALVPKCYTQLLFRSRDEREWCEAYAHDQGDTTASAEDLAVLIEDQPELEAKDAQVRLLADTVKAHLLHDEVALGVARLWEEHGTALKPAELAKRLGVPVTEVYAAQRVVRYQAENARKALRRRGAP